MDLSTTFMGLELAHPLVPSASPLTGSLEGLRRLEEAGASAVVVESAFDENLDSQCEILERCLLRGTDSHFEALDYFPPPAELSAGPSDYLGLVSRARVSLGIPVIASLHGVNARGWTDYARDLESAGAHALELNLYFMPTDPRVRGVELEDRYVDTLREVKSRISIPLAVKLRPSFTAPANVALRLVEEARVDGLVMFNRFYGPDYDLESLDLVPRLVLSTSDELRLPMTWTAVLHHALDVDLALATGIHTHHDVLKATMAGASVTQIASELMLHGLGRLGQILAGMREWLEEREYDSLRQLRGSMCSRHLAVPEEVERPDYAPVPQAWQPV